MPNFDPELMNDEDRKVWDRLMGEKPPTAKGPKEAWERIAPELPPETCISGDEVVGYWIEWWGPDEERPGFGMILTSMKFKTEAAATEALWALFGGRKRYAELIAVERVREVAEAKVSEPFDVETVVGAKGVARIWVVCPVDARLQFGYGEGPTLCDAAWACIQALGGE